MAQNQDEIRYTKSVMQVWDPRQANFQEAVNLVERDPSPNGFQLVNPEESGKVNQRDLVELATEINKADKFTRAVAGSKLSAIAEQVKFLQAQANKCLQDAQRDKEINHMACNMVRRPGNVYYIYKRKSVIKNQISTEYMSLIAPEEWGPDGPEFVTAYKLNHDMTWTPMADIAQKDAENAKIDQLLQTHQNNADQLKLTFI